VSWRSEEIKLLYLKDWKLYFSYNSLPGALSLSLATGLPSELIEGFRAAEKTLDFTIEYKKKIKTLAEGIPVQRPYKRNAKDFIWFLYHASYLASRYQGFRGPVLRGWMTLLRNYVNGKETRVAYYPPVKEVIEDMRKDVFIRRVALAEQVSKTKVARKPRRSATEHRMHVDYVSVDAVYKAMTQMLNPNLKQLRLILDESIKGAVSAYFQDLRYGAVGKMTISFLNAYINQITSEERKHLTQADTLL